ncbi:MAG: hypothetical protein KAU31_04530, partial [Spirochaetaceae bacterium]|nr:hypothetical protein [Spirochaetaceae bacterium]
MNRHTATGRYLLIVGLVLYALLSLWSLPWFPFVHSDEAWLASLTRSMIEERSIAATEDFFVLTPRYPHAIKVIYHLFQMPFVAISFSAVAARLLSWAAGIGSLVLIYLTARPAPAPRGTGVVGTGTTGTTIARVGAAAPVLAAVGLFAGDLQLLTAFHTARQEAVLVLVFALALFLYFRRADSWRARDTVVLGIVLGASIGIHPNSFIIAAPFVPLMLITRPGEQPAGESDLPPWRHRFAQAGLLMVVLAGFAALFVGVSLLMDREFFAHYAAFGRSVGVDDSLLERWFRLRRFVGKLYHQTAGTYYLPPIRLQLILSAGAVVAGTLAVAWSSVVGAGRLFGGRRANPVTRAILRLLICIVAVALAIFAVGKYSPPSIVFILPPIFLLVGSLVAWMMDELRPWRGAGIAGRAARVGAAIGVAALVAATGITTVRELAAWRPVSYAEYQRSILDHVEQNDIVLGNLNTAFTFDYGRLRTWRDLAHLDDAGLSFQQFVEREGISVILYPDELDLIYRERPV